MSKKNWIKAIVTIIVLVIIAILGYMRFYPSQQWGAGDLKQAEKSYSSLVVAGCEYRRYLSDPKSKPRLRNPTAKLNYDLENISALIPNTYSDRIDRNPAIPKP